MTGKVNAFLSVSRDAPAVVFVNRSARGNSTAASLSRIETFFAAHAIPSEFVVTTTSAQLEARARAAITRGQHLLLASGGDGTFQGLANAALGSHVLLGVLPAGGGNDFATALGLPKDANAALEAMFQGQPKWVDLMRARTADGRERLYTGGGGVGLDAEAMRYANGAYRHIPGRLRYIAAALRALRGFQPLRVSLEFPRSNLPALHTNALLAGVLNTPTYGGGVKLAPDARIDDGCLDVAVVEDLSVADVLAVLPALLKSGELQTPKLKRIRARSVRLTTSRPCLFHGDGEILGPAPVEIEVLPRAVQVLAPAKPVGT